MDFKTLLNEAARQGALEQLTPVYRELKTKGDGFVGRLKGCSPVESGLSGDSYNQYLFDTDDGLIKCAFGGATDKEAGALMDIGRVYVVEFQGKELITGGRTVNKFSIQLVIEDMVTDYDQPEGK